MNSPSIVLKTIPMSTEDIQALFLDQSQEYTIDVKNSKLQGEAFITYIANMQMNCLLLKDDKLESSQKSEILLHYIKYRQTVKCQDLLNTYMAIMFYFKGLSLEDLSFSWLTEDEIIKFVEENNEILNKTSLFLDSSLVFVPAFHKEYKETFFESFIEKGQIEVLEDPDFLGVNALGLFTIPNFIEHFTAIQDDQTDEKQVYYKYQVEQLRFDRKSIYDILSHPDRKSFLIALINMMFNHTDLVLEHEKELSEIAQPQAE